jgi:hypothetical protein
VAGAVIHAFDLGKAVWAELRPFFRRRRSHAETTPCDATITPELSEPVTQAAPCLALTTLPRLRLTPYQKRVAALLQRLFDGRLVFTTFIYKASWAAGKVVAVPRPLALPQTPDYQRVAALLQTLASGRLSLPIYVSQVVWALAQPKPEVLALPAPPVLLALPAPPMQGTQDWPGRRWVSDREVRAACPYWFRVVAPGTRASRGPRALHRPSSLGSSSSSNAGAAAAPTQAPWMAPPPSDWESSASWREAFLNGWLSWNVDPCLLALWLFGPPDDTTPVPATLDIATLPEWAQLLNRWSERLTPAAAAVQLVPVGCS